MKAPKQDRSAASTDKMIEAVLDLAAERGLDHVTIDRVSKRAGVSNGAIFHRFKSRNDLIFAASDRLMTGIETRMNDALAALEGAPADRDALGRLVSAHMALFEERPGAIRAFMVGAIGQPDLEERGNRAARRVARGVGRWLRAVFATDAATEASVYRMMFAAGTVHVIFPGNPELGDTRVSPEDMLEDLIETIWTKLSVRSGER